MFGHVICNDTTLVEEGKGQRKTKTKLFRSNKGKGSMESYQELKVTLAITAHSFIYSFFLKIFPLEFITRLSYFPLALYFNSQNIDIDTLKLMFVFILFNFNNMFYILQYNISKVRVCNTNNLIVSTVITIL